MNFITQVSIYLLIIGSAFCEVEIPCNDDSSEKLDEIVRALSVLGDPDGRYPINETDFTAICQEGKQILEWAQLYIQKCMKGLSLQVISLSVTDMDLIIKKYCDSPKLGKLYISWGRCGNAALNQTIKCWDKYTLDIERVNVEKSRLKDIDIVGLTCCDYYVFEQCVDESYQSVGPKECPAASSEGLQSILSGITDRVLSFLCGEFQPDNDKCDSLLKRYKYLNDIKLNKPLRKSPASAMVQIMDNKPEILKLLKQKIQ